MHTTIFTESQPLQLAVLLGFGKRITVEDLALDRRGYRTPRHPMANVIANIVPFRTGYGGLQPTQETIDQFRDFGAQQSRACGRRDGVCCGPFNVSCVSADICSPPLRLLDVN